jgi:Icc-related predicted phosphoesterase
VLKIGDIEATPVHRVMYLNAARGGGTETSYLDVLRSPVSGLGDGCEALLVTSDLQGMSPSWYEGGESLLLGEVLAEQMEVLAGEGIVPPIASTGVVLAGDMYSVPEANKRGGFGDVSSVWYTFAAGFRWVVGVAGNHDDFGDDKRLFKLTSEPNVHLLDGDVVELDGVRFGGVGYIMGNPRKAGRRSDEDQLERIELVLSDEPDVLILHEGPNGDRDQMGNMAIRSCIEASCTPLTVCGHKHWDEPIAEYEAHRVLNVDARAVLLVAE